MPSFFVGLRSEAGPGHVASGPDFQKRERGSERGGEIAAGRMLRSCRLQKRETALDLVTVLPVDADDDDDESLGTVQLRLGRLADVAGASEVASGVFRGFQACAAGILRARTQTLLQRSQGEPRAPLESLTVTA